jgi:hypothetical protein
MSKSKCRWAWFALLCLASVVCHAAGLETLGNVVGGMAGAVLVM